MRESPRIRRLRTDLKAIVHLKTNSSILDFIAEGDPPESYLFRFHGKGFWRPEGASDVLIRELHEMTIELGASYPRMMPELAWKTPIFHPNISANGVVCLGGYGTHWAPSVSLDELCMMLWDMIRYQNFDIESPYNREAAAWAKTQSFFILPIDDRPLRDRLAGMAPPAKEIKHPTGGLLTPDVPADVTFLETEVVDAEIADVEKAGEDILFIE